MDYYRPVVIVDFFICYRINIDISTVLKYKKFVQSVEPIFWVEKAKFDEKSHFS